MDFETLGDWCKWLEKNFSNEVMIPTLPVIIRLDGNNFHNWTKGLERPFDKKLTELMTETTKFLVQETNAIIGYTQSDEKRKELLPTHDKVAVFDCRIYQTPTLHDACVQLLWRENDATKNSISMLAQSLFPHKQLQNLNGNEMQDKMMLEKGVNWNDLEVKLKRGTYVKRIKTSKPFTADELKDLPPMHQAHKNPNLIIERSVIKEIEYPIFSKIGNKEDVIFYDAEPILNVSDGVRWHCT